MTSIPATNKTPQPTTSTKIVCIICADEYTTIKYPIVFNCGHSVCCVCNVEIKDECPLCKRHISNRTKNYGMIDALNCDEQTLDKSEDILKHHANKLIYKIYKSDDLIELIRKLILIKPSTLISSYQTDTDETPITKKWTILDFEYAYYELMKLRPNIVNKKYNSIKFTPFLKPLVCNCIAIFTMFSQLNNLTKNLIDTHKCKFGIGTFTLTPIMIAAIYGNDQMIEYYLSKGEYINFENGMGRNALYFACKYSKTTSNLKTVEYLMRNGARLLTSNFAKQMIIALINTDTCDPNALQLVVTQYMNATVNSCKFTYHNPMNSNDCEEGGDDDDYYNDTNDDVNKVVIGSNSSDDEDEDEDE